MAAHLVKHNFGQPTVTRKPKIRKQAYDPQFPVDQFKLHQPYQLRLPSHPIPAPGEKATPSGHSRG